MIWLTNSDYNTLLTIASEMVLVPYFLVGAYLLKLVWGKGKANMTLVALGACAYGLWLLYASGPLHLLMSVILMRRGCCCFVRPPRRPSAECAERGRARRHHPVGDRRRPGNRMLMR